MLQGGRLAAGLGALAGLGVVVATSFAHPAHLIDASGRSPGLIFRDLALASAPALLLAFLLLLFVLFLIIAFVIYTYVGGSSA